MKMIRLAAIGLGNRCGKYLSLLGMSPEEEVVLVAAVDPNLLRLKAMGERYGLPEEALFASAEDFFAVRRPIDGVIIASPDSTHCGFALSCIEYGYAVLLEKPLGCNEEECRRVEQASERSGVPVCLCYEMRYHPFYLKLREYLASRPLGAILSARQEVHVGRERMTHSFVRGDWACSAQATPIAISKASHDLDLLLWLTGAREGTDVRSRGGLSFFRPEKAPAGSSDRCINCPLEPTCEYSAVELYKRRREWVANFDIEPEHTLDEAIDYQLREGRYGRCVFACGNDVADYQQISFTLSPLGARATVVIDGLSGKDGRLTVLDCERGRLEAWNGYLRCYSHEGSLLEEYDDTDMFHGDFHAGADQEMLLDFLKCCAGRENNCCSATEALPSHLIGFAAEL